jgi:hypothetical protein
VVQPDDSSFRVDHVFRDAKKIALRKTCLIREFRQAAHPRRIKSQDFLFVFGESSAAAFGSNDKRFETWHQDLVIFPSCKP